VTQTLDLIDENQIATTFALAPLRRRNERLAPPECHPLSTRPHFHCDRAIRLISSAIFRIRSRTCVRRLTLSSLENSGTGGAGCKGRKSGVIEMSNVISKETTLAETHEWKYLIIHFCMNASLTVWKVA
jgi:hypothetical protein